MDSQISELTLGQFADLSEGARRAVAERLYAGRMYPDELIALAQRTDSLFPTRIIKVGESTFQREADLIPLDDMCIETDAGSYDLYNYFSWNRVVGCLVIKEGRTVFERYQHGVTPQTRWMSMSMAKSVSTTLVGAAVQDGHIESIDDLLVKYLPACEGSAYADVTVRQLMLMASGVQWNDVHTDPISERRNMLSLQAELSPGVILDYVLDRPKVAPSGQIWNYSMGETHMVGALVHVASGRWLSDYLSEKIWSPFGMQNDASWWLEAPDGLEVAGAGLCVTLQDYVRFGEFMLAGGTIEGERILPDGWVEEATRPTIKAEGNRSYGFMWWPTPNRAGSYHEQAYSARGIFGQYVYVNPAHKTVIGVISSRPKPLGAEIIPDDDFFNAVVNYL